MPRFQSYPLATQIGPSDLLLISQAGLVKTAEASNFTPSIQSDSIADLKLIVVTDLALSDSVNVLGFAAPGDGGGGIFFFDPTSALPDNGGTIIAPAAGVGRWLRNSSSIFNVWWFGAFGDFTDVTAKIQACITAAEAYSQAGGDHGAVVLVPAGQYLLTSTLAISRISITLTGAGVSSTGFFRSADYGDTFVSNAPSQVAFTQFYCYTFGNTTSGAHIRNNGSGFMRLNNLFLRRQYGGIRMIGGGAEIVDVTIETGAAFTSNQAGSYGIQLEFNTTTLQAPGVNCVRLSVAAIADGGQVYPTTFFPPEYGINILSCDSAYFTGCYSGNARVNVRIKSVTAYQNSDQNFTGCFFDGFFTGGPTEYGVYIEDDGVANTGFVGTRFTSCFFGGQHYRPGTTNTGRGIFGTSTIHYGLTMSGCTFSAIGKEAINLTSIRGVNICGSGIYNVNKSNTSSVAVLIAGSSKQLSITGNFFGDSTDGFAMSRAISLTGTCDNIAVNGNAIRATTLDPILVTTSGLNLAIDDNANENPVSIASATALALPAQDDIIAVTGITTITSVTGGWNKRRVTLRFTGILTFTDGSNLKLAGNFVTSADDTISLFFDGTNWIETGRSAN